MNKELQLDEELARQIERDRALFTWKNEQIKLGLAHVGLSEVSLRDWFDEIFCRHVSEQVEPYEEELSDEYQYWLREKKKLAKEEKEWKKTHGKDVPFPKSIDYTPYAMWRYNPIVFVKSKAGGSKFVVVTQGERKEKIFASLEGQGFAIASPITYVGDRRTAKNARYLYAIAIDLDYVGEQQFKDVFWQIAQTANGNPTSGIPVPNLLVNSGTGLHLYYYLKTPVQLYENKVKILDKIRRGLIRIVWNANTSEKASRQYESVYQGFRLPGTRTKFGEIVKAWKVDEVEEYTLAELNNWLGDEKVTEAEIHELETMHYNPRGVTLEKAKEMWPEWYERRIEKKQERKHWIINRALYDWWLRTIKKKQKVVIGHRYYCIMILAVYARKCDVAFEEVEKDAVGLIDYFNSLGEGKNPFTDEDVRAALKAYKSDFVTLPRTSIEYLSGVRIDANPRNGQKQKDHLADARMLRDARRKRDNKPVWDANRGRNLETPMNSKLCLKIAWWRAKHQDSKNKSACARDLEIDRTTVAKWWSAYDLMMENLGADDRRVDEIKNGVISTDDFQKTLALYAGAFEPKRKARKLVVKDTPKTRTGYKYITETEVEGVKTWIINPTLHLSPEEREAALHELFKANGWREEI